MLLGKGAQNRSPSIDMGKCSQFQSLMLAYS
jgi:hypothetical protein